MPRSRYSSGRLGRFGALMAALVVTGALLVAAAPSALASCAPGRTNDGLTYLDGWYNKSSTVEGVVSDVLNYSPYVYPGSVAAAWTMLTIYDVSLWAQVGWLKFSGSRYTFVQYKYGTGPTDYDTFFYGADPTGSYSDYLTLYDPQAAQFDFYDNGIYLMSEPAEWIPNSAQVFGEIHTLADQMPGGYYDPDNFSDTLWQVGSTAYDFNGVPVNYSSTYFNNAKYSSTDLQIGDQSCAY